MKCKQALVEPGSCGDVDHWRVVPDVLTIAKSLGGDVMPISAVCTTEEIFHPMRYPNPFKKGNYLISKPEKFAAQYPRIYEKITGRGLLIGMHFKTPKIGYQVASGLFKSVVLVAGTLTSA